MRVWVKVGGNGKSNEGYRDLQDNPVADCLEMVMATMNLVELRETFADGTVVTYRLPLEYRCEWCGSYEHKSDDCPDLDDTDDEP